MELVARCLKVATGLDDEHLAVLVGEVDLAVRGDRRRAEPAAHESADAGGRSPSRSSLRRHRGPHCWRARTAGHDRSGRRHVRTRAPSCSTPGAVRRCAPRRGEVAAGAGPDGEDRPLGGAAAGHDVESLPEDRGGRRDLRAAADPPQLASRSPDRSRARNSTRWSPAPGPPASATTVGVPHEGSSSRSVFHTVRPLATSSASRNESACVSTCRITEVVPDDRRAGRAPLVGRDVIRPHVDAAEVHRPERRRRSCRRRRRPASRTRRRRCARRWPASRSRTST